MSKTEEIEVAGIIYIVRELDTFDDQLTLIDEGTSFRAMMKLSVTRKDEENIDWKKVSKEDGKKILSKVNEMQEKEDFPKTTQAPKKEDSK